MAIISFAKIALSSGASVRNRLSRRYLDSGLADKSKTFANLARFEVFCWIIAIKKLAKNSTRRLSNGKFARNAAKHADVFFSYIQELFQLKNTSASYFQISFNIVFVPCRNPTYDFAVVRYNADGSLDSSFGGTGIVITPVGDFHHDYAASVAIQSDGKIVAAGVGDFESDPKSNSYDFVVVRYQGGSNANIRTRFDFDADGKADISVFRPSDRVWYLNRSTQGFSATQFGLSTDKITPADFDGDGKTDISVYREGIWYRLNSSNGTVGINQFGLADDIPVPADFTGDGRAELAVYRSGVWWSLDLSNNQVNIIQFGISTDKPIVADYDDDGRADQAVYRNGEWHLNRSTQSYGVVHWGLATDKPVIGDYDGDGKTDQAVYRDGTWYILQSLQGWAEFNWGIASDTPAPADYDGDGKTDAAVFRNGVWYLRQSTSGISIQQFGLANDKPVPAAFLP